MLKAAGISATSMFLGDLARQKLSGDDESSLCFSSAGRFALVGATLHGPYFYQTFRLIDRLPIPAVVRGAGRLGPVIFRTLVVQCSVFPVFVGMFYLYMGLLEGGSSVNEIVERKAQAAKSTVLNGALFWIPANLINFAVVPSTMRAPYVAGMGLVWNVVVSYINSKGKISSSE